MRPPSPCPSTGRVRGRHRTALCTAVVARDVQRNAHPPRTVGSREQRSNRCLGKAVLAEVVGQGVGRQSPAYKRSRHKAMHRMI